MDFEALEHGKNYRYNGYWQFVCNYTSYGNRPKNMSKVYRAASFIQRKEVWSSVHCSCSQYQPIGVIHHWHFLGMYTSPTNETYFCFLFSLFKNISILFQVRLANNTYTLDKKSLFEYETHFTVMVIFLVLDPTFTDFCSRKQLSNLMIIFFQLIRITGERWIIWTHQSLLKSLRRNIKVWLLYFISSLSYYFAQTSLASWRVFGMWYYDKFLLKMPVKWSDIHSRVKQMIRKVFESAALVHVWAMYGVDVMRKVFESAALVHPEMHSLMWCIVRCLGLWMVWMWWCLIALLNPSY